MTDPAHLQLARDAIERGNGRRAIEHLATADVQDPDAWYLRSRAFALEDDDRGAEQSARQGLMVAPEYVPLLIVLGQSLSNQNRLVDAEKAFVHALNQNPEHLEALHSYAWLLAKAGDPQGAREVMAKMPPVYLAATPSGHALSGYVSLVEGNVKDARMHLDAGLTLDPDGVQLHTLKALELSIGSNDLGGASQHLRTAAQSDPAAAGALGRQARYLQHPLMRPIQLVDRIGVAQLWIAWIATLFLLPRIWPGAPMGPITIAYIGFAVYTWVVPFALRKWMERRGQL